MTGLEGLISRLRQAVANPPGADVLAQAGRNIVTATNRDLQSAGVPARAVMTIGRDRVHIRLVRTARVTRPFRGTTPAGVLNRHAAEQMSNARTEVAKLAARQLGGHR